jgi:sugar-specific transcriptional regulator TrmB
MARLLIKARMVSESFGITRGIVYEVLETLEE